MNSQKRSFLLLSVMGVLAGCATLSPLVNLNPAAPATVPSFNNHPAVVLSVEDTRANPSLGDLPAGPNVKGTPTQSSVAVAEVVRKHLTEELTRAGFQVLTAQTGTAPELLVNVKKLEFKMEQLGVSSQINGIGTVEITAKAGAATRTKTYSAENGKKWAFSPPADGHEKYMNELLTDILNSFLTDENFLTSLTTAQ